MSKPAIVLLSGGLDSTTVLALAKAQGFTPYALSFRYGQRHSVELDAAHRVALAFDVAQHIITGGIDPGVLRGSALTDDIPVPKHTSADELSDDGVPVTYVPARNTIFLAHALGYAETVGAADIFIGVNALDYSGYPDCRPEYIAAFETMANLATRSGIEGTRTTIHTPLISLSKADIIKTGLSLGIDYGMTWSCYDPTTKSTPCGHIPIACGQCDSCLLRLKGFSDARAVDPLQYATY